MLLVSVALNVGVTPAVIFPFESLRVMIMVALATPSATRELVVVVMELLSVETLVVVVLDEPPLVTFPTVFLTLTPFELAEFEPEHETPKINNKIKTIPFKRSPAAIYTIRVISL